MSTPLQASQEQTYRSAISLLENARSALTASQGRISDAAATLGVDYKGSDGMAFGQLLEKWLNEVNQIKNTCGLMEEQLETSLRNSSNTQGDADEMVNRQMNLSARDNAFNTLAG
ncbi:hypothetical protein ACIQAC_40680 [Streptomyces sp. NPDC088387]|uniref:hypothetical protein n=1 Tax=Streptomyces sp. NPDC088387 TaxID=3365859 RepID=UPI0037FBFE0E